MVAKRLLGIEAPLILPLFVRNGANIQGPNMIGLLTRSLVVGTQKNALFHLKRETSSQKVLLKGNPCFRRVKAEPSKLCFFLSGAF